jgi:rod shape-determining protein MreB
MRNKHKLYIGKRTAEQIKIRLLTVKDEDARTLEVKGRCMESKAPRVVALSSREMLSAISEPLSEIMEGIIATLDQIGDDMRADVVKEGMLLTGGGVLSGFDWFLSQLFKVKVRRAENASNAAVEGAALALSRL